MPPATRPKPLWASINQAGCDGVYLSAIQALYCLLALEANNARLRQQV